MLIALRVVVEAGSLSGRASEWKTRNGVLGSNNQGKYKGWCTNSGTVMANLCGINLIQAANSIY